jgi:hypothetical protein
VRAERRSEFEFELEVGVKAFEIGQVEIMGFANGPAPNLGRHGGGEHHFAIELDVERGSDVEGVSIVGI